MVAGSPLRAQFGPGDVAAAGAGYGKKVGFVEGKGGRRRDVLDGVRLRNERDIERLLEEMGDGGSSSSESESEEEERALVGRGGRGVGRVV